MPSTTDTINVNGTALTLNNNINGNGNLTIQGTGTFQDNGEIGNTSSLASLTVNAPAIFGGTSATTTGDQTYNMPITLIADTQFVSTGGNVTINNNVNGDYNFNVSSANTSTIAGLIGTSNAVVASQLVVVR